MALKKNFHISDTMKYVKYAGKNCLSIYLYTYLLVLSISCSRSTLKFGRGKIGRDHRPVKYPTAIIYLIKIESEMRKFFLNPIRRSLTVQIFGTSETN